ncbi:uncharacterized protein Tco025E_03408 [Trypanosoma conorhini]|uniref:Uncharacterized protein n=1 Tax=Trypanosoma conorhini TaxID=83891 RepID=A0A422PWP6_9TRYP|nr:uncharacterized protein Tco025E_03408 [Trypanosoma conorhini]RNF22140.1 hypothetical protein Tco025E_03408 [Trypanosoma conorhini]
MRFARPLAHCAREPRILHSPGRRCESASICASSTFATERRTERPRWQIPRQGRAKVESHAVVVEKQLVRGGTLGRTLCGLRGRTSQMRPGGIGWPDPYFSKRLAQSQCGPAKS